MKKIIVLVCSLIIASLSHAQVEIGILSGASNYYGDLSKDGALGARNPSISIGVFAQYYYNTKGAIRLQYNRGKVSGSSAFRNPDNPLSFTNRLHHVTLTHDYYYLIHKIGSDESKVSLYVSIGGGIYTHNPKTYLKGEEIELQPLGTEGQTDSERYNLTQFSIPFGGGVQLALNRRVSIGLDYMLHFLFTDYIDDVSTVYPNFATLEEQRGPVAAELSGRGGLNPVVGSKRGTENRDMLSYLSLTVSYNLGDVFGGKVK